MVLYHGTLLKDAEAIRKSCINPEINISHELDFGYGFYLGWKAYAKRTARRKSLFRKESDDYDKELDKPAIMVYTVDYKGLKAAFPNGLTFWLKTFSYLNMVFACRYSKGEKLLNAPYVYSPIADGNVDDVMEWYKEKKTARRKLIAKIRYFLPELGRQLVLKSYEACKYAVLDRIETEKGEVLWKRQ